MDRLRRVSRGHIFGKTFRLTYSPNVRCRGGARLRSMTETEAQSSHSSQRWQRSLGRARNSQRS